MVQQKYAAVWWGKLDARVEFTAYKVDAVNSTRNENKNQQA